MSYSKVPLSIVLIAALASCTSVQTAKKIDTKDLRTICIVEHKAVRNEVLEAIEDVLLARGIKTLVVRGDYRIKDNRWSPTYQLADVAGCDAVLFYVAQWQWDLAMYMNFATLWVVSADAKKVRLGDSRYDARASLNKYINARDKIAELTRQLIGE